MKAHLNHYKNGNHFKNTHHGHDALTVATFLNRQQIDYLDKIGKDFFFKYGHKISRGKILEELVELLMHLNINYRKIDLVHENFWEGLTRLIEKEKRDNDENKDKV